VFVIEAAKDFSLSALKPSPGGMIKHFCEQPTVTATCHSLWR